MRRRLGLEEQFGRKVQRPVVLVNKRKRAAWGIARDRKAGGLTKHPRPLRMKWGGRSGDSPESFWCVLLKLLLFVY